jgi:hypothetical protein
MNKARRRKDRARVVKEPGARKNDRAFAKSTGLCINAKPNLRIAKFPQLQN